MSEKRCEEGAFKSGDLVVYAPANEDGFIFKCEIGVIKSVNEKRQTAFVAYHVGDTCACTLLSDLIKVHNAYATEGLVSRMNQLGNKTHPLAEGCEDWSELCQR